MALSKRSLGWCKVYLIFPFVPVIIEAVIRVLLVGGKVPLVEVPPYSSALVSMMAISIFLHDELNKYRLPDPDDELITELTGNRYTMIIYFLSSVTLFSLMVFVSLIPQGQHNRELEPPLNFMRFVSILALIGFVRTVYQLQAKYKLSVSS